jgi:spore maturation protein SpmB
MAAGNSEKQDLEDRGFPHRLKAAGSKTVGPAFSTALFLLCIMIPVSFAVLLLDQSGVLYYISLALDPVMRFLGLSGEAALVFISSIFLNIYSAIAVIETLNLSGKEVAILAAMCFMAHNFFVELTVMKKTGSSFSKIALIRLGCALFTGWVLHFILPESVGSATLGVAETPLHPPALGFDLEKFPAVLRLWFADSLFLALKILLIVFGLIFLQKILDEFGIMKFLGRLTTPLMRVFGLPENAGYLWIVAYLVGVMYGSAILIEEVRSGALSRAEADLFNHHVGISHSHLEDTLLFMSIGVPFLWAAVPRLIMAFIVVWLERGRRALIRRSFRVKVMER